MDYTRIVFEKGIEIRLESDGVWRVQSAEDKPLPMGAKEINNQYKVQPIVAVRPLSLGIDYAFLLSNNEELEILDLVPSKFYSPFLTDVSALIKACNIGYVLGSVHHHCKRLAIEYSEICRVYAMLPHPEGRSSDQAGFSYTDEPYYELDALLTAAHRAYDTIGKINWHVFGPRGDAPHSFENTIEPCKNLSPFLKDRLNLSWDKFGKKINDYRDCIQHYAPLHPGITNVDMMRLQNGVWSISLIIPDNPEVRSQNKYKYDSKIDALKYGWELTNEITEVARLILDEVPKVSASTTLQPPPS